MPGLELLTATKSRAVADRSLAGHGILLNPSFWWFAQLRVGFAGWVLRSEGAATSAGWYAVPRRANSAGVAAAAIALGLHGLR